MSEEQKRRCINFSEEVWEAYLEYVQTLKLVNKVSVVKHDLVNLFKKAKEDILLQKHYASDYMRVCQRTHTLSGGMHSAIDGSILQARAMKEIEDRWLNTLEHDKQKQLWRIPVFQLHEIITRVYKVTDHRTIKRYKDPILDFLELSQVRIKGKEYIVLTKFYDADQMKLTEAPSRNDKILKDLIEKIKHRTDGIHQSIIARELHYKKDLIQRFRELAEAHNIFKEDERYFYREFGAYSGAFEEVISHD